MAIQFDDDAQFQEYKDIILEVRAESRHKDRGNIVFPIKVDLPAEPMTAEQAKKVLNMIASHFKKYANDLQSIFCKYWEYLRIDYIKSKAEYDFLAGAPDWVKTLEPYLIPIAAEANKDFTLADFYRKCFTEDWEPVKESPYFDLVEEAEKRRAEHQKAQDLLEITVKHTDLMQRPTDKISRNIWGIEIPKNGIYRQSFKTGKVLKKGKDGKEKKVDALIYFGMDFNNPDPNVNIKSQEELTIYDKEIYRAIGDIWNAGNEYTTASQIYSYAFKDTSKPNKDQRKIVFDSLTKLRRADIFIDNVSGKNSEKKLGLDYKEYSNYESSLLPIEIIKNCDNIVINGQKIDNVIHIFREPPLLTFAKERKQVTNQERKLLQVPISITEINLLIRDYLIDRICWMKNGKSTISRKILYKTVYENCKLKDAYSKKLLRAKESIKKCLEHYKSCDFIKGYSESKDGITIIL